MEIRCSDNVSLFYDEYLDVIKTMTSGQSFRYEILSNGVKVYHGLYSVVLSQKNKVITSSCDSHEFVLVWSDYFGLYTDYSKLSDFAAHDSFISSCLEYGKGLRVLSQDLWETIVFFILSQRSSIPKTTLSVKLLCKMFGDFPAPEAIASCSPESLSEEIRCGYRGKYLVESAKFYANNKRAMEQLDSRPAIVQKSFLLKMYGVGEKVADCVALFGLHNHELFPVDIWIERIIDTKYNGILPAYRYGRYAGIIQQYMYYYAINHKEEFM